MFQNGSNNADEKVFRHLKRTPPTEFLELLKQSKIYVPEAYSKDFLMFSNFCKQNNWTFDEGLILYLEHHYDEQEVKLKKKREEIHVFKD
jgi:hypothetical protein